MAMTDIECLKIIELDRQFADKHTNHFLHETLKELLNGRFPKKMRSIVVNVLKQRPKKILDIGCGYGALALFFAIRGINVVGIDLNTTGFAKGEKLSQLLKLKNIEFIEMNACHINLKDFDFATSTDFYEHLTATDQALHLDSVYKALKPKAYYFLRAPHRSNIRQDNTTAHTDHIGLPSYTTIAQQAEHAGFKASFTIAHTPWIAPINYHSSIEQWIEKRKWSPLARYKLLQKCGLANVIVQLKKTT